MRRLLFLFPLLMFSVVTIAEESCGFPDARFEVDAKGVVKDKQTHLTWMSCSLGMDWDNGECVGRAERYDWQRLQSQIAQLNAGSGFAGATDWRLPTQTELESLIDRRCYDPAINGHYFSRTVPAGYWSSTAQPDYDQGMILVYFLHGQSYLANKEKDWFVRLVRK